MVMAEAVRSMPWPGGKDTFFFWSPSLSSLLDRSGRRTGARCHWAAFFATGACLFDGRVLKAAGPCYLLTKGCTEYFS